MSSNRLIYDTCAYKKSLDQSVGPLSYLLNPIKYENCSKCRMELGIVGGTDVSQIKGNLVDLENDLRGATRTASLCPSNHYQPSCQGKIGDELVADLVSLLERWPCLYLVSTASFRSASSGCEISRGCSAGAGAANLRRSFATSARASA